MIEKAHILAEICRTAAENGGQPLGIDRFEKETGIRQSDWRGRYWVNWNNAVAQAGFEPNTKTEAISPDFMLKYWHQRFSEKRLKGEWFRLSLAEIRMFKRWKTIF